MTLANDIWTFNCSKSNRRDLSFRYRKPHTGVLHENHSDHRLLVRVRSCLNARGKKYVMMNAPEIVLPKLKKIVPGLKSPTIGSLIKEGWVSLQTVIKEEIFWETIEKLKQAGATGIIVLPVEKMII